MRELEVYVVGFDEMNLITGYEAPGVFATGTITSGPILVHTEEDAIKLAQYLEGSPGMLSVFECRVVIRKIHPVPALQRLAGEAE
jgi:hypothetical protein